MIRITASGILPALKQLLDNEFGSRIMFGTDQMLWPGAIGIAVNRVKKADYLTEDQKRDIFFSNSARFFGLHQETISAHPRG